MHKVFLDTPTGHPIRHLRLDRSGSRMALLGSTGTTSSLALYERAARGWHTVRAPRLPDSVTGIAFSPDSARLLLATADRWLSFEFGGQTLEECPIRFTGEATELEWFETHRIAAAAPEHVPPAQLLSFDRAVPLLPSMQQVPRHLPRLSVSHDGHTIAFCHVFEFVSLFDAHTGTETPWAESPVLEPPGGPPSTPWTWTHFARRIWFSADDARIAVASQPRGSEEWAHMGIRLGERDGTNQRLLRINSHMGAVDLSPDFALVAAAVIGQAGDVAVFDGQDGSVTEVLSLPGLVRDLRFSEDGRLLVVACSESVTVFER